MAMSDDFIEKRCAVTGIGQSEIGRRLYRDPLELTLDACLAAVDDAGLTLDDIVHADLTATPIIELFVASINALSRDLLFPGHPRYVVDLEAAIRMAVAGLARDPDSYDENIADIRALCVKRGIDVSKFPMPPKQSAPPAASRGPTFTQRQITGVAVDGTMAGLATIADAVRLTSAMTFPSGL